MGKRLKAGKIKVKWPSFVKELKKYIAQKVILLAVLVVIIGVFSFAIRTFLHNSGYFSLAGVEVEDVGLGESAAASLAGDVLKEHKGRNIFDIDIRALARSLRNIFPEAKNLAVKRVLPDRLLVKLNMRKPIAVIGNGRRYPVDEEGFVLPRVDDTVIKTLPVISGVGVRAEGRTRRADSDNLKTAVAIIKMVKRDSFLASYGLSMVDAEDIMDASFYFANGVEVKIGCENLKRRLELLKKTLRDPRLVLANIDYIDVRFDSAVIGPK